VVESIHSVTARPASRGPNQGCCPATARFPLGGTTRSSSTASGGPTSSAAAGTTAAVAAGVGLVQSVRTDQFDALVSCA